MNELTKPNITMTVQQIAEIAGIPKQTVRNGIRQLFPHIPRHGKRTVLNETESKQLMNHLRKKNLVEHVQNGQVHVQNGQLENRIDRLENMVEALVMSVGKMTEAISIQYAQKKEIEYNPIKQDYYTIKGYCILKHIQITSSAAIAYGKKCASLSRERALEIRQAPDEQYAFVGSYHISVLSEIIGG